MSEFLTVFMKILLVGNGAREHVIAETLKKNKDTLLYSYLKSKNPGIISLSKGFELGNYNDSDKIRMKIKEKGRKPVIPYRRNRL